jgi:Protein of unknown function (DUF3431)
MRKSTRILLYHICISILILIVFALLLSYLGIKMPNRWGWLEGFQDTQQPRTVHLVISRYQEDLSWIPNIPTTAYSKGFIYNKGTAITAQYPNMELSILPNLGREGHTYVHHIVQKYNELPDIILFIPGSVWTNENKRSRLQKILDHIQTNGSSVIIGHKDPKTIDEAHNFSLDIWDGTSQENSRHNPENKIQPSSDRPLRTWFEKRFAGESLNCVSFLGIVAASREDIQKRPIEFYRGLLEELSSVHPEAGHYTERTWKTIFSISDAGCIPV